MKLNTIIQGDAVEVMKTFSPNSMHALITDPPYNYEFIGRSWNSSEVDRRLDNAKANGTTLVKNIPYGSGLAGGVRNKNWYRKNRNNILQYEKWCELWAKEAYRVLKPGSLALIFNSTRTVAHIQTAFENQGFYARDIIVWKRNSGIPRGLNVEKKLKKENNPNAEKWHGWHSALRNEWEAIAVLQKPLENNYLNTLKKYNTGLMHTQRADIDGFQSNIIENISNREKKDKFNTHPTVKPLKLMEELVKLIMPVNSQNILLDPFIGSGTTSLACKHLNVNWVGIEINPEYIDIANKRLNEVDSQTSLF